jgi:hypothetical protein
MSSCVGGQNLDMTPDSFLGTDEIALIGRKISPVSTYKLLVKQELSADEDVLL